MIAFDNAGSLAPLATVVLVLAAHWQDEVNVGAVEGRATVVTTLNTLYDRYREMARPHSSTAISSTRFRDLLKEMGQRSLVDLRRDTYARLISLPMTFFAQRRVGELASAAWSTSATSTTRSRTARSRSGR